MAVADTWHGPYTVLGNPHPGDSSDTSFHSQISSVFKVRGKKDLYIACADRWLPNAMDKPYHDYAKVFTALFNPDIDKAEKQRVLDAHRSGNQDAEANTSIADYVWLPLRFIEPCAQYPLGMVLIDWLDEWSIEDYEDA